ncbi:MAG: CRISPR system precrRNA processing endoribonuclease RAMP protein Cas6 [Azospirillaceae bacterium]|nr:CRISPR system precrRNA processing endoribonuclease RAMP protein Cas6 [Azospirillaceae bacterium]
MILPPKGGALILKKGQFFTFGMRLFGSGIERLPFVVQSWRQALARGLGPMRGRARLTGVWAVAPQADAPVALYDCDTGTLGAVLPENPVLTDGEAETTTQTKVTLDFRTPLRLQVKGRPLRPADITPRRLVGDVVRRVRILTAQCGTPAAQANVRDWPVETWLGEADGIRSDQALRWQDWRRYSRRQDQAMILGGVVGQMVWQEIPASVLSLLRLATRIHVGKETVFGFGEVSLA